MELKIGNLLSLRIGKAWPVMESASVSTMPLFTGGMGMNQSPGDITDAAALSANKGWVYSCVDLIGKKVSTSPCGAFYSKGGDDVEYVDHPYFTTLREHPNPLLTGRQFRYSGQCQLDLAGIVYVRLMLNGRSVPEYMWLLPANEVTPQVSAEGILTYRYQSPGRGVEVLSDEEVMVIKYPHPSNPMRGWSPLHAVGLEYSTERLLVEYQWELFNSGARMDSVLTTDSETTEAQRKRIGEALYQRSQGKVKHRFETIVLDRGLKPSPSQMTNLDLGVETLSDHLRDKILGAYKVPRGLLGLTEGLPRANLDGAQVIFAEQCILPRLEVWGELETAILRRYDSRLFCKYESPVPPDQTGKLAEVTGLMAQGAISINVALAEMGYDPSEEEGADRLLVPMGRMPLEDVFAPPAPNPFAPPAPPSEPESDEEEPVEEEEPEEEEDDSGANKALISKAAWTPARRRAHLSRWEAMVNGAVGLWTAPLGKLYDGMEAEAVANLEANYAPVKTAMRGFAKSRRRDILKVTKQFEQMLPDQAAWSKFLADKGAAVVGKIVQEFGEDTVTLYGGTAFNLDNPRAEEWIATRAGELAKGAVATNVEGLREVMAKGMEEGLTLADMTARVQEYYGIAKVSDAERIARTESGAAANAGSLEGARQVGGLRKVWLSAGDANTRATHLAADANYAEGGTPGPIGLDELFNVGDATGPAPNQMSTAGESVNCRCAIGYVGGKP